MCKICTAQLWVHCGVKPKDKGELSNKAVKFAIKCPFKSANATNLIQSLEIYIHSNVSKLFLDVQKVIKSLLFLKVYATTQNVY